MIIPFILLCFLISSCSQDPPLEIPFQGLSYPSNFPPPVQIMTDNPVTREGFELGRTLFYDPILSRNNTISCGSCHIQTSAFTHHGHDLSHGIDDLLGKRNALPIQNLLWQSSFFWDGGVYHIDMIPLNPIENPVELDESLSGVLQKLKQSSRYPALFQKAFGSPEINTTRFLQALSQFQAMLISANSRYDRYVRGEGEVFTEQEKQGLLLFKQKCGTCHATDLFSDFQFRNNGLNSEFSLDSGRYAISLHPDDIGKFKVPSLRNIAKTSPYMHNGQLRTLDQVLDHYRSGVKASATLDPLLMQNGVPGLNITDEEKQKIIAFLLTLTDDRFIRDPRFSEQ